MTASDTRGAIDAVWRIESARLIAGLTRIVRDLRLAEDLAQDALVPALARRPDTREVGARVPRPRVARRRANGSGQGDPPRGARPIRGPPGGRAGRPSVVGARGPLLFFKWGLPGDRR